MGENFNLAGHLDMTNGEENIFSASGSLKIEEGEILWGKFFGDLKSQKPSIDLTAITLPPRRTSTSQAQPCARNLGQS